MEGDPAVAEPAAEGKEASPLSTEASPLSTEASPLSTPHGLNDSLLHLRGTNKRLILGMVGLPGRGKTFLAQKVCRYLNWLSYNAKVFDQGNYRRAMKGRSVSQDYFNDTDTIEKCCEQAMEDVMTYFASGQVAIYDANNHTNKQRDFVRFCATQANKHAGDAYDVTLVWVEVFVDEEEQIENNIMEMFATSPDYASPDISPETLAANKGRFMAMIKRCETVYESLTSDKNQSESFIQIRGSPSTQFLINRIHGYLMSKIVVFLMSFRTLKHNIYMSRHGESIFNTMGKLGGDSFLSPRGRIYADKLGKHIRSQPELQSEDFTVWCSTMNRTRETASYVRDMNKVVEWRALMEIDAGVCDGLTVEQIADQHPEIHKARSRDKLRYRYPGGESYEDIIQRLEPVILELNRLNGPALVICHRAVLRCLYAYFVDIPSENIPHLSVPLHTLIKLTPKAYGCDEDRVTFGVDSVDDATGDEQGFQQSSLTNSPEDSGADN